MKEKYTAIKSIETYLTAHDLQNSPSWLEIKKDLKAYEELKDDVGVLLNVLDASVDDSEAKYILDQIIIKLSKVGVEDL